MPILMVNGLGLYYEVHGEGAPVAGIHGTPSSALMLVDAAGAARPPQQVHHLRPPGFYRSERKPPLLVHLLASSLYRILQAAHRTATEEFTRAV